MSFEKTNEFIAYCVDRGICLTESNRDNVIQAYKDFEEERMKKALTAMLPHLDKLEKALKETDKDYGKG